MNEMVGQGSGEITPETHVKMSINKLVAVAVAVIAIVFVAAVAWRGLLTAVDRLGERLAAHIADKEVHIDPSYQFDHGRPVGHWDVDAYKAETTRAIDDLKKSVDELKSALVNRPHRN